MRQRQEAERHIFFADRQPFIMQVELRRQVAVVQHHPFRLAGSARGIDQGEEILQVALFNTLLTLSDKSRRIGSALEGAQMLCDLAAAQIGPSSKTTIWRSCGQTPRSAMAASSCACSPTNSIRMSASLVTNAACAGVLVE